MASLLRHLTSAARPRVTMRRVRVALLILFGAGLGASITASHVVGTRLSRVQIPALHAIESVETSIAEARLAAYHAHTDASEEESAEAEGHLQRAELHLLGLAFGGSCAAGAVPRMPLEECRRDAVDLLEGLTALRHGPDPWEHDREFRSLQEGAHALRLRAEEKLAAQRAAYAAWQSAMAMLGSAFLLLALVEGSAYARRLRAAQRDLRESQRQLAQLVAEMPVMVVATGADGRICFWNRECERVTGYAAEEIVGHPDPLAKLYPDAEYRASQLRDWSRNKGDFRDSEWKIACKNGARRVIAWSDVSARAPIAPWRYWTVGVDVTERHRALSDLGHSRTRYAELIDNMQGAVAVYEAVDGGEDFIVREFNRAAERAESISREAVIGRRVREVFPGVEAFGIFAVFQRVWRTGEPESFPLSRYRDDRLEGWRENYIYRLPTGEVVAVYSDETERMRAAETLRYHASLAASVSDPVVSTDPEYRITSWNRAAEELYGWSSEEIVGRAVGETIRTEPLDGTPVATAKGEIARAGRWSGEVRGRRKDGSELFLHLSASLLLDERGRACGLVTIHRDITDFRRALEALQASEARFRAITENSQDITIILDRSLRLRYISPAVAPALGWAAPALIGSEALDLVHPDDRESVTRLLREVSASAGRAGYIPDFRARRRDGGWVHLEGQALSMLDLPGVDGLVAICRDVTDRRRTEKILRRAQKAEAVGTLAGGIAHDFNNILYALLGYAQLAHDELPSRHPARDHLEQVLCAGNRATDLVRRLLTFARQTEQSQRPFSPGPLVEETIGLLRGALPGGIRIASRIEACGEVRGDPTQIQQLAMNLGTNAIQAMRETGGEIEIRLEEVELGPGDAWVGPDLPPGRYARLLVRDTGCGMDAQTLERVFEPYFSTRGAGEGIGLGLAMVEGILRNHRGACRIESSPGKGTSFHTFLPLLADARASRRGARRGVAPRPPLVLLADPDDLARAAAERAATAAGCAVESCASYEEALDALARGVARFALALIGGTGPASPPEGLRELLSRTAPRLPTILLEEGAGEASAGPGARPGSEAPGDALEAVRAILGKPIDGDRLAGLIAELTETGTEEQQWRAS